LEILQREFDAVLLELYDTRKALEETRRELSTALYQNDAAVRVIARVCAERDEMRHRLGGMTSAVGGEKRSREEDEVEEPSKKAKTEGIPSEDMDAMTASWSQLSAARRPIAKLKRSPEEIAEIEKTLASLNEKKVNVHKSNSNGVLGLSAVQWSGEDHVVSIGKDGQILVYNVSKGVIGHTIACAGVERVHASVIEGTLFVCASTASDVKLFSVQEEATLQSTIEVESPVGITIHPSSSVDAVRIMVASATSVMLVKSTKGSKELEVLTTLKDDGESKFVTGAMHPDGLIYAVGTESGKLIVWDLKTQVVAMTIDVSSLCVQFIILLCILAAHLSTYVS
jgi:pre-mRNA-processing factor 19